MVLDSLPDRPLSRSEVDSLDGSDSIQGNFPVYGQRPELQDTAIALVLVINGTAYALAYTDGWETVETRDVDADEHGLSFDEQDTLTELQNAAAREAGAQI